MTRPRYETEEDRRQEAEVAKIAAEAWRCDMHKMPESYVLDYLAIRNGIHKAVAVVEVKCRDKVKHDFYPTYMVAAKKVLEATRWRAAFDLPSFIVVRFLDGVFYSSLEGRFQVAMGGRRDRNDRDDIEPMAHIQAADMIRLKSKGEGP